MAKPVKEPKAPAISKSASDLADKATKNSAAGKEKAKLEAAELQRQSDETQRAVQEGFIPSEEVVMPLKDLEWVRALQMRATGNELTDPATEEEYAALMRDGAKFPPIKAIRIPEEDAKARGFKSNILPFDGFHTGGACKLAKIKEHPVQIMGGTWRIARLFSVRANASHGKNRTISDKKRTFHTMISDPVLLADAQVFSEANRGDSKRGGLTGALANLCGISTGLVHKLLEAEGKYIVNNTIQERKGGAGARQRAKGDAAGDNGTPAGYQPGSSGTGPIGGAAPTETIAKAFHDAESFIGAVQIALDKIVSSQPARAALYDRFGRFGVEFQATEELDNKANPEVHYSVEIPFLEELAKAIEEAGLVYADHLKGQTAPAAPRPDQPDIPGVGETDPAPAGAA